MKERQASPEKAENQATSETADFLVPTVRTASPVCPDRREPWATVSTARRDSEGPPDTTERSGSRVSREKEVTLEHHSRPRN